MSVLVEPEYVGLQNFLNVFIGISIKNTDFDLKYRT